MQTKPSNDVKAYDIPWQARPFLHIKTAAQLLGVSRTSIYRMKEAGHLRLAGVGSRTVVRTESLLEYIKSVEDRTPEAQS